MLVVALGNTLRGDDGVGWGVGSQLLEDTSLPGIQVIFSQQLLPEHTEPLSRAGLAIFVDCSAISEPGIVSSMVVSAAENLPTLFTHHLDPASLLRLTDDLYGRVPARVLAVTVGGAAFDDVDRLTAQIESGMESALGLIRDEIRRFRTIA